MRSRRPYPLSAPEQLSQRQEIHDNVNEFPRPTSEMWRSIFHDSLRGYAREGENS